MQVEDKYFHGNMTGEKVSENQTPTTTFFCPSAKIYLNIFDMFCSILIGLSTIYGHIYNQTSLHVLDRDSSQTCVKYSYSLCSFTCTVLQDLTHTRTGNKQTIIQITCNSPKVRSTIHHFVKESNVVLQLCVTYSYCPRLCRNDPVITPSELSCIKIDTPSFILIKAMMQIRGWKIADAA